MEKLFSKELDKLNLKYLDTKANFIHVNLKNKKN